MKEIERIEEDIQKNGKTSHGHWLEELVLKCYYLKQPTDSTQSLSEDQWYSSQNYKKQS
jgi:hypothetical protein